MHEFKDRCANCMWGDTCSSDAPCKDYTPLFHSDERYTRYIENQRVRFRREWWEYIADAQGEYSDQ